MKTQFKIIEQITNDGEREFEVREYSNDWFSWLDPSWKVRGKCKTLNEAKEKLELEVSKLTKSKSVVYETTVESKMGASILS